MIGFYFVNKSIDTYIQVQRHDDRRRYVIRKGKHSNGKSYCFIILLYKFINTYNMFQRKCAIISLYNHVDILQSSTLQ